MDDIKIWIKSLTGFVFICAIIEALVPEAPAKRALRMLMGVVMSILIITPIVGINIEEKDIFENSGEYINYNDTAYEMQELTQMQSQKLYQQSVRQAVEEIVGEETEVDIIFLEENQLQEIIIHKNVPEKKADIAAALGVFPSKIQMTE